MNPTAWIFATLSLFVFGVWRLATIPPTSAAMPLAVGWGCVFAAAYCLTRAVPYDEDMGP